ncbi:MAG: hypothetical protein GC185_13935 [Alphaproteobacteria bacterium]|nr:hypothetical protein [Alphaproteobacteria bacterium]
MNKPIISREALKGLATFRTDTFEVRGHVCKVKEMSVADRRKFVDAAKGDARAAAAQLVVCCLIDATGSPLFTDGDLAEVEALPFDIVDQIVGKILVLSGMEKGKDEDDDEGNA